MNSQKSQNRFQNFRNIWNQKAENNACYCVPGIDRHCKRKADVRNYKKNACYYRKNIVTGIRNPPMPNLLPAKTPIIILPISITNTYAADTVKTMER